MCSLACIHHQVNGNCPDAPVDTPLHATDTDGLNAVPVFPTHYIPGLQALSRADHDQLFNSNLQPFQGCTDGWPPRDPG